MQLEIQEDNREKVQKKNFKEMMAKKFPKFIKTKTYKCKDLN